LREFEPGATTAHNIRQAFHAFMASLPDLGSARFFLRDSYAVPLLEGAAREQRDDAASLLRDLLARGIASGDVRPLDPDAMARVLLGAFSEATLHVLTTGKVEPTLEILDRIIDSLQLPELTSRTTASTRAKKPAGKVRAR